LKNRHLFNDAVIVVFLGGDEMDSHIKITYTKPKQLPLFEEQDDGHLTRYSFKKKRE